MPSPDEFEEAEIQEEIQEFISFEQQVSIEVADVTKMNPKDYANYVSQEFPNIAQSNTRPHNGDGLLDLYDELRMGERKPIVLEVEPEA